MTLSEMMLVLLAMLVSFICGIVLRGSIDRDSDGKDNDDRIKPLTREDVIDLITDEADLYTDGFLDGAKLMEDRYKKNADEECEEDTIEEEDD